MKKVYWGVFIIIAVGATAGLLYIINKQGPAVEQVVVKSIEKTKTSTSSPTNTSGWQTYTNSQYGFSFQYPQNWNMNINQPVIGQDVTIAPQNSQNSQNGFGDYSVGVDYSLERNQDNLSLINWINQNSRTDGTNIPINVAGISSIKKTFMDDISGDEAEAVFIPVQAYVVNFSAAGIDNIQILDQILPTFRFTQPQTSATSTTGWQAYNNSQYGFSFKYPADYTLKENSDPQAGFYILITTPQTQQFVNETGGEDGDAITIVPSTNNPGYFSGGILPGPITFTATYFQSQAVAQFSNQYIDQINVNGKTAFQLVHSEEASEEYTIFQNPDKSFLTVQESLLASNNGTPNSMEPYNTIISTFKFSN